MLVIRGYTILKLSAYVTDFQYGYGLPGFPAGFNPFLLNPGWFDAAYMSYALPDYLRHRPNTLPQTPPSVHPSLMKGKDSKQSFLYIDSKISTGVNYHI